MTTLGALMIKKAILLSLSLLVAPMAFAASEMDEALLSVGLINKNYEYIHKELITEFFRVVNNDYSQSLPMDINSYTRIQSLILTPYYGNVSVLYTLPLTADERDVLADTLSSKEMLKEACVDYYLPNKFMLANSYTMVYSYADQNHRALADIKMNADSCLNAILR